MNCPRCNAAVDPTSFGKVAAGEAAKAIVTDWRVWAVALGANLTAGVIGGALGLHGSALGAGAGVVGGLFIVTRLKTLRKCPHCGAVAHFAIPPATPAPPAG